MNVIVIVMDSLRVDHVGCYGSHVRTPNIDHVAQEGTLFVNAFSESLPTLPTRTTWWTGRVNFPFRPGSLSSGVTCCWQKCCGTRGTPRR